jgi:hypothetical protein
LLAAFAATVMIAWMTERLIVDKPGRTFAKPLRDLLGKVVGDTFRRQGFASAELVTRWPEIAGAEIAAHSEPIKIQWPRASPSLASPAGSKGSEWGQAPGTLVLRVEGPAAIEIQHLAHLICERVNRFLGWRAVERITLRQAPLRRALSRSAPADDAGAVAHVAATMPDIADDGLRQALARLGAAVKRH